MDRPLDERGAVVERDDLHPRREPGCQRRDPLLDPVDHVDRADAVTGDDDAPDGFISALEQGADAEGVANLHVRHLTDEDWHTPLGAHHDLLDVLDALDQPELRGLAHGLDAVRGVELSHRMAQVLLDRVPAEKETRADLRVREPLGHEARIVGAAGARKPQAPGRASICSWRNVSTSAKQPNASGA